MKNVNCRYETKANIYELTIQDIANNRKTIDATYKE